MSKCIEISSPEEFQSILQSSHILVVYFHADWCESCKKIAPVFDDLSTILYVKNLVMFVKVNIETLIAIASDYAVTSVPVILLLRGDEELERISGVDIDKVKAAVRKIISESERKEVAKKRLPDSSSNKQSWPVADIPKGFYDVTEEVDLRGLDILNADYEFGSAQVLFDNQKPTGLNDDVENSSVSTKDWVESDTDEQLMLYIPFRSVLKIHSLQITSVPPKSTGTNSSVEIPMRPKTIKIYINRVNILGFDEADQITTTQTVFLNESDWDATGTANLKLRLVKFQNITSLVLFIVDGINGCSNDSSRTRLDRIRIIGDSGERRDQGVLEKYGD